MPDLDLILRTPGRVLMLERSVAEAMIDRAFEERRSGGGNLLTRAFSALTHRPRAETGDDDDADRQVDRSRLATASVPWAGTIEWADGYAIVDGVAVIDICGVLTPDGYYDWWTDAWYGGYTQIGAAVALARVDDRVHALFLRINSPGGLVDGCFDLAADIAAGNGKSAGKPVWASVRTACSAAYALASAADRILAASESDVGSIGVYVLHVDASGWLAEHGVKIEAIQNGARKTDGHDWKPLSDDARAKLQSTVDQIGRRFAGVVNAGRALSTATIAGLEGQWFLAQHDDPKQSGLALGLVDEIATEQAAFAALQKSLTSSGGASPAAPGSTDKTRANTETDMPLAEQIAALRAKAANGDTAALAELKSLGISAKAEDATDDDAGDDDETDGDGKQKPANDDDDDEDGDGEPEANATGADAGFKLLNAKEAKGRTDLANRLARKVADGKLTYGEAKDMLASAPKSRPLADAMANRDRNPGNDAGAGLARGAGLGAAIDRLVAKKRA